MNDTPNFAYMPDALVSYKMGSGLSTDILNNAVTLGTTSFLAMDVMASWSYTSFHRKTDRKKRSGYDNHANYEGIYEICELTLKMRCQSFIPLAWCYNVVTTGGGPSYTHTLNKNTAQSPSITPGSTAIPAFAIRLERKSSTDTGEMVDFLGCFVKSLELKGEDESTFEYTIVIQALLVLRLTSGAMASPPNDLTQNVYHFGHANVSAWTYNSKTIGFELCRLTLKIEMEWAPTLVALKASVYYIYTQQLLKDRKLTITIGGKPYTSSTTYQSVYDLARTPLVAYATACALTITILDSSSYGLSLAIDKVHVLPIEEKGDRESNEYEDVDVEIEPAIGWTLTATITDAYAASVYGGN